MIIGIALIRNSTPFWGIKRPTNRTFFVFFLFVIYISKNLEVFRESKTEMSTPLGITISFFVFILNDNNRLLRELLTQIIFLTFRYTNLVIIESKMIRQKLITNLLSLELETVL